jgi:hypothetical protein
MYLETIEQLTMPMGQLARDNDSNEMVAVDDFRSLLRDEASIRKMKEPLYGNGRFRCDPVMRHTLVELAWFYDSSRIEEVPCWDPYTLEKMRHPVVGFGHYRVTPTTMPILFDFAWFHAGLLDGEI